MKKSGAPSVLPKKQTYPEAISRRWQCFRVAYSWIGHHGCNRSHLQRVGMVNRFDFA